MTQDKNNHKNRVRETLDKLYDQEIPFFRDYLRRFREDPTSRVFAPVAETYRKMGRLEEAISICKEGLKNHPNFHSARVLLARCLIDKNLMGEAKVELEQVVKAVPDNLLAQRLLGEVLEQEGKHKDALHAYKMALLLSPEDIVLAEKVHKLEQYLFSLVEKQDAVKLDVETKEEALSSLSNYQDEIETENLDELDNIVVSNEITDPMEKEQAVLEDEEPEAFSVEHISNLFSSKNKSEKEITTETLADLYFSQGQYDKALKIYERLSGKDSATEIEKKLNICRMKLGVDKESLIRKRKIKLLNQILMRLQKYKKGEYITLK